jgi:hypothetical protein
MDKILKLLEIAKKFGVKPSKVIGTQGNVVPYKKPSLVDISVDEFKLKESIDSGAMTMDKVQQEMEETVRLALSKNLNDTELNRALNNAINIERQFFPPSADVIAAGSGEKVTGKGLEELIEKEGLISPPSTPIGKIQFRGKRLEQEAKDLSKEFDIGALIKGAGKDQLAEIKLHNEGLVRAVTRQILSEDIKAGKIKSLTLDDLGTSREPIDYFRKIYGENALEQLDSLTADFNKLNTEQEAASLARSKFKFEPDEFRLKGSTSYEDVEKAKTTEKEKGFFERLFGPKKEPAEVLDITTEGNKRKSVDELIDEYNANQDRTRLLDEEGGSKISYEEFQNIQKRNDEIAKALEEKGIKSITEPEEVKTEGIVIPFRKKFTKPEPEGKAQGGIIGYAMGGRIGFAGGKSKTILDLIAKANKKLKGKKSMESVNPQTGEVTVPKEPVKTAEGITVMDQEPVATVNKQPTKEDYEDYAEILNDSENTVVQGTETLDELDALVKKQKDYEGYMFQQYKRGKLDPAPGEQTEARMKFLQKKFDEVLATGDRKLITLDEAQELQELQFASRRKPKVSEADMIKQKYGSMIDEELLQKIMVDDNPQRKAEVLASLDEAIKMQQKGIPPEEIINIINNTTRTKQAKGGPAGGLDYLMGF